MKGLLEIIATCEALAAPAALATLVRVKGSSYRKPGARMVFLPGGAQTGLISMIGKAERGPVAIEAIKRHRSAYLMAVGGAAYLVSKAIKTARVVGFADLGMEAIYEFDVVDMPVTVAVDAGGTSAHITGPAAWQQRIASGEFKTIAIQPL